MDVKSLIWADGWMPTNDIEVSQLLKYYRELDREQQRLTRVVKEEIELLEAEGKEIESKHEAYKAKILDMLGNYVLNEVDEEDRKETQTQIKYVLPRGEITIKKEGRNILKPSAKDEAVLTKKYPKYVKSELKFQWGEFKKTLELSEDGVVFDKSTGQEIDNVPVVDVPKSFSVKLTI